MLLISDAKIAFDAFRNGMAATVFSKTVITVNPGEEAQKRQMCRSCALWQGDLFPPSSLLTPALLLSQTPERRASCSATLKKPLSLGLWIWMRKQKMELVGVMNNSSVVKLWPVEWVDVYLIALVLTPATLFHFFLSFFFFFFKMAQWTEWVMWLLFTQSRCLQKMSTI